MHVWEWKMRWMRKSPLNKITKSLRGCVAIALLCGLSANANATVLIWENSAGSDMGAFDPNTGVESTTLTQNKGNGRGIVVVGDTVYYTTADSGNVYKRSASTNADL